MFEYLRKKKKKKEEEDMDKVHFGRKKKKNSLCICFLKRFTYLSSVYF